MIGHAASNFALRVQIEPSAVELEHFKAMAASAVAAQAREPTQRYRDFVRQLHYGSKAAVLQPLTLKMLRRLDAGAACAHFSRAFRNPAEFTLCFAGALGMSRCVPAFGCSMLLCFWWSPGFHCKLDMRVVSGWPADAFTVSSAAWHCQ